jgi:hypothetical protein
LFRASVVPTEKRRETVVDLKEAAAAAGAAIYVEAPNASTGVLQIYYSGPEALRPISGRPPHEFPI